MSFPLHINEIRFIVNNYINKHNISVCNGSCVNYVTVPEHVKYSRTYQNVTPYRDCPSCFRMVRRWIRNLV